jgi:hypothetical protein
METGKIIVAMVLEKKGLTQEFLQGLQESDNILKYEYEFFGFTSYTVAAHLFEYWKFDPAYVKILKNLDHTQEELSKKLLFCKNVLKIVRTVIRVDGSFEQLHVEKAMQMVTKTGLDATLFEQTLLSIQENSESVI